MSRDKIISVYKRQANMHYDSYFMHCSAIAREAKSLLSENKIEYKTLICFMFYTYGLCISIKLNDNNIPDVIPAEVFFEKVKTQEDIKIHTI